MSPAAEPTTGPGPGASSGLTPRPRLLRRLTESPERTIVLCAPSGYGKSVLLGQWADQDPRPAFTTLLGPEHNDPTVLVEAIIARLSELEPFPTEISDALQAPSPDVERVVIPRLIAALAERTRPFVLVLDELERIEATDALRVVAALCRNMPAGSQLALAVRSEPPIGLGRLRAGRRLTELGSKDLTMTKDESGSLLATVGSRAKTGGSRSRRSPTPERRSCEPESISTRCSPSPTRPPPTSTPVGVRWRRRTPT